LVKMTLRKNGKSFALRGRLSADGDKFSVFQDAPQKPKKPRQPKGQDHEGTAPPAPASQAVDFSWEEVVKARLVPEI
jgi:hypothetical protein